MDIVLREYFSKDGERIVKRKKLELELARKNFSESSRSFNGVENFIKSTEVRRVGTAFGIKKGLQFG